MSGFPAPPGASPTQASNGQTSTPPASPPQPAEPAARPRRGQLRHLLGILGPGLVTGAADDDPSGIATYSQTGAQFGYGQLWTALWMLPLVIGVQEACGRIGNITGQGLARNIKDHYSLRTLACSWCSSWPRTSSTSALTSAPSAVPQR